MKLLHRREEHLQDVFNTARSSISRLSQDSVSYTKFLEVAIVQGYLLLMDPNVVVQARPQDMEMALRASEAAASQYRSISGRDIQFRVEGNVSKDWFVDCLMTSFPFLTCSIVLVGSSCSTVRDG
jgi:V-type H+-transporting ATPase subunit E